MKLFLLCLLLGSVLGDFSVEWGKFKHDYNKKYATVAEELERKQIFIDNVNKIRNHQKTHPNATFTMGINHLTDRRVQELVSGKIFSSKGQPTLFQKSVDVKDFPASLDWRVKGVVSPAHDQGLVGEIVSAIVSTEVVESFNAIETKKLIEGSISRVYDCCPSGTDDVFDCIKKMGGICPNSAYPVQLSTCEPDKCKPFATFDRIDRLADKNEDTMLAWIQESTLWAEVDASQFQIYTTGIYDSSTCSQTEIDHVLQIVGYGSQGGVPFWICKNSWGANWGEMGYIRIARGKNMCAIATNVVKVANEKKSGATRSQTILPMSFIILLTMIVRKIGNCF